MEANKRKTQTGVTIKHPNRQVGAAGKRFEDVFGRNYLPATWQGLNSEDMLWAPVIDVIEKDDKFLIKAELPGVKDEDINVIISGNTLTIEGEKSTESEVKKKAYYYSESSYGSFARSITIPSNIDVDKIDASCDKGILSITLPKIAEIKPKKIALAPKKKQASISKKEEVAKK